MENFDRENIDELLKIRQIRQYFPPSKFCTVRYHWNRHHVMSRRNLAKGNRRNNPEDKAVCSL